MTGLSTLVNGVGIAPTSLAEIPAEVAAGMRSDTRSALTGRLGNESGGTCVATVAAVALAVAADICLWRLITLSSGDVAASVGVPRASFDLIIGARALATMAFVFPVVRVQARFGSERVVAFSAVLWSLAALVVTFAAGLAAVLIAGLLWGAATATVFVVHVPLLLDVTPPARRSGVLVAYVGAAVGGSLAAGLALSVAAAAHLTWRAALMLPLIIGLYVVVIAWNLPVRQRGRFDEQLARSVARERLFGADDLPIAASHPISAAGALQRIGLNRAPQALLALWGLTGIAAIAVPVVVFSLSEARWQASSSQRLMFAALTGVVALVALGRELSGREDELDEGRTGARQYGIGAGLVAAAVLMPSPVAVYAVVSLGLALFVASLPRLALATMIAVPAEARPIMGALTGLAFTASAFVVGPMLLSTFRGWFGIPGSLLAGSVLLAGAARAAREAAAQVDGDLDRLLDEIEEDEWINGRRRTGQGGDLLRCSRVDFSYGQLQVLFDVDFRIAEGEMVGLLGTNGAGKSTLLRVISGLGIPSRGTVRWEGTDVTFLDAERRLDLGITQVPGGKAIFAPLSVVENLRVYAHSIGRSRRRVEQGIERAFEVFPPLEDRRNLRAGTLSGGEQQMLALAKALILRPKLLLIDELSLGLAPIIVGELLEMVREMNRDGMAVVLVEQSVNVALSLVDRAYFMEKGQVRFEGPAQSLLGRTDLLRSVFLEGAASSVECGAPMPYEAAHVVDAR